MHEAGSEGREDDVVTFLQPLLVVPHGQRDGSGARVAVVLDVDHDLLQVNLSTLGDSLDDTAVGLMGNDPVDIVAGEVVALHNLKDVIAHVGHGIAEYRAALLVEVVETVFHGEVTGRADTAAGLHVKEGQTLPVSSEI